jgi:hypothetical protein
MFFRMMYIKIAQQSSQITYETIANDGVMLQITAHIPWVSRQATLAHYHVVNGELMSGTEPTNELPSKETVMATDECVNQHQPRSERSVNAVKPENDAGTVPDNSRFPQCAQ